MSTLQATVARLESQVIRYKSAAEASEKAEDELKVEKRKLQREVRRINSYIVNIQKDSCEFRVTRKKNKYPWPELISYQKNSGATI